MSDAADPTSQYPAVGDDIPRVHSQDPAEGADPDGTDQVAGDVSRVHGEDPVEGATDTTNPQ